MKNIFTFITCLKNIIIIFIVLFAEQTMAHSPYFSKSCDLALSNGSIVKIRILNIDGIIGADPQNIVIDDEKSLLAANSRQYYLDLYQFPWSQKCWGYSHWTFMVYTPDPKTFHHEKPIEITSTTDNYDYAMELYGITPSYNEPEGWGFKKRIAYPHEFFWGELIFMKRNFKISKYYFFTGFVLGFMARPVPNGRKQKLWWGMEILGLLIVIFFICALVPIFWPILPVGIALSFGFFSITNALIPSIIGIVIAILCKLLIKKRKDNKLAKHDPVQP